MYSRQVWADTGINKLAGLTEVERVLHIQFFTLALVRVYTTLHTVVQLSPCYIVFSGLFNTLQLVLT